MALNFKKGFASAKNMLLDEKGLLTARKRLVDYMAGHNFAHSQLAEEPRGSLTLFISNHKFMMSLVLIISLLFGGGGAVLAAQNNVPGDILYPVKIATENVEQALATSPEQKAQLKAEAAQHRAEELAVLAKRSTSVAPTVVADTAQRLQQSLQEAYSLTQKLPPDQKLQVAAAVNSVVSSTLAQLTQASSSVTSTEAVIAAAVRSALQSELNLSQNEQSAVEQQPALQGLRERAQNKINEVTNKINEVRSQLNRWNNQLSFGSPSSTVSSSLAEANTLLTNAATNLTDASSKFASADYSGAFISASTAQQLAIQAQLSLETQKSQGEGEKMGQQDRGQGNEKEGEGSATSTSESSSTPTGSGEHGQTSEREHTTEMVSSTEHQTEHQGSDNMMTTSSTSSEGEGGGQQLMDQGNQPAIILPGDSGGQRAEDLQDGGRDNQSEGQDN